MNDDEAYVDFSCHSPSVLVNEQFSTIQLCSLKNSVSEKSNLFSCNTCFPVMQEATRGGGSSSKANKLFDLNVQSRELLEHALLSLVLRRKMQKREANNFCLRSISLESCLKVLEVSQDCSSRNSLNDPNYPRQLRLADLNYPIFIFVSKEVVESDANVRRNTSQDVRLFVLIFSGPIADSFSYRMAKFIFE